MQIGTIVRLNSRWVNAGLRWDFRAVEFEM